MIYIHIVGILFSFILLFISNQVFISCHNEPVHANEEMTIQQDVSMDQVSLEDSAMEENCPLLDDPNARIWKDKSTSILAFITGGKKMHLENIKNANLDKSLSTCFGSLSFTLKTKLILMSSKHCKKSITHYFPNMLTFNPFLFNKRKQLNSILNNITKEFETITEETDMHYRFTKFLNFREKVIEQATDSNIKKGCSNIKENMKPCLEETLFPLIINQMINPINPCCNDFRQEFKKNMGHELSLEYLNNIINISSDLFCAERRPSYTSNKEMGETCGYVFIHSLFDDNLLSTIPEFLQIPNNQSCLAFEGKRYSSTTTPYNAKHSEKSKLSNIIGCCATYYDHFISFILRLPMVRNMFNKDNEHKKLYKLFKEGQCLRPLDIRSIKTAIERMGPMSDMIESFVSEMCLHIPNGFECDYKSSTCSASYKGNKIRPNFRHSIKNKV